MIDFECCPICFGQHNGECPPKCVVTPADMLERIGRTESFYDRDVESGEILPRKIWAVDPHKLAEVLAEIMNKI